uniref:Uncharacterized protein n=1 Tax=uncultured Poseidoniia archaeon TaxID=1697135 RepID=A0A1B1TBS3_9ARCH|nr:hypothetical protein [uncultured Candidatus Thalassoarchaea sp.]
MLKMNIRSVATLPSLMGMRHGNVYSNKLTYVKLRNKKVVGALGFEPRSAGVFRLACTWQAHALGLRQVGAPVGHQNHQKTISYVIPVQRGARCTTRLYYYPHRDINARNLTLMMVSVIMMKLMINL